MTEKPLSTDLVCFPTTDENTTRNKNMSGYRLLLPSRWVVKSTDRVFYMMSLVRVLPVDKYILVTGTAISAQATQEISNTLWTLKVELPNVA